MPESQVPSTIRLPGHLERYYIARSHVGYYNNVGSTATYTIPPSRLATLLSTTDCSSALRIVIYGALAQLIRQHPSLGISVTGADTQNPSWKRLESIDLPSIVTFGNPVVPIEEQLATMYNQPILGADGTSPLWRILVIPTLPDINNGSAEFPAPFKLSIGFFHHHAIGDGLSGAVFHQSFFPAICSALQSPSKEPVVTVHPPGNRLPLAFETAIPLTITFGGILRAGYALLFPPRGLWAGAPTTYSPKEPVTTKLSTLSLSATQAAALAALCKQHGTTVTSLLVIVVAETLANSIKNVTGLSGTVPVSLRTFAKGLGEGDMGTYVSAVSFKFLRSNPKGRGRLGGGVEWEEMKRVKEGLVKAAGTTQNQLSGFLKYIPNMLKFFQDKAGKPKMGSFEVSNLGVVDLGEETGVGEKVGCERIIFGQSANLLGPACSFSVATVKGGEMNVYLCWQDGAVDDEVVEQIMTELKRWLTTEVSGNAKINGV